MTEMLVRGGKRVKPDDTMLNQKGCSIRTGAGMGSPDATGFDDFEPRVAQPPDDLLYAACPR